MIMMMRVQMLLMDLVPMDDCENILMVASGFGIAAQLPYLKRLIHGYNARKLRAHRIHLVWQVRNIGKLLTYIIFIKTKI